MARLYWIELRIWDTGGFYRNYFIDTKSTLSLKELDIKIPKTAMIFHDETTPYQVLAHGWYNLTERQRVALIQDKDFSTLDVKDYEVTLYWNENSNYGVSASMSQNWRKPL